MSNHRLWSQNDDQEIQELLEESWSEAWAQASATLEPWAVVRLMGIIRAVPYRDAVQHLRHGWCLVGVADPVRRSVRGWLAEYSSCEP
jgi:hypothetical protein